MTELTAERSPAHLGAAAAADLIHRRPRNAVEKLAEAVAADPGNPCLWSDLSAAYLQRNATDHQRFDVILAVSAADRALSLRRDLGEAAVNLAIGLESLALTAEARAAWCAAAATVRKARGTGTSAAAAPEWLGSLEAQCDAANRPRPAGDWPGRRASLLAAADPVGRAERVDQSERSERTARQDAPSVRSLVLPARQQSRELVLDEVLPQWGAAVMAGQAARATAALRLARDAGQALAAAGGDATVAGAVRALDEALPSDLARAAQAHIDYAAGRLLYRQFQFSSAGKHLHSAITALEALHSPLAPWARLWMGGVAMQLGEHDTARTSLQDLLSHCDTHRYPALAGLARWLLGLSYARTGLFAMALEHYRAGAHRLASAGEALNLIGIEILTAEVLDYLGQPSEAWNARFISLNQLRSVPASVQRQNLLRDAALAAESAGQPDGALHLWRECVRAARDLARPELTTEALLQRGRLEGRLGENRAALIDLRAARQEATRLADPFMRVRLGADIQVAAAEIAVRTPAGGTLPTAELTPAISFYQQHRLDIELVPALLVRASIAVHASEDDAAEADLRQGIETFEQHRNAISDPRQHLSILSTGTRLFDAMIGFQLARRHNPALAFDYAERARTSLAGLPPPLRPHRDGQPQRHLAAALVATLAHGARPVVVLEYTILGDDLLIWRFDRNGWRLIRRAGEIGDVRRLVQSYLHILRDRGSDTAQQATAAGLFDRLIRPAELSGNAVPSGEDLFVIPDGFLNSLPFAALWDRQEARFLIEQRAVALCPQARLLLRHPVRPPASPDSLTALVVGNPAFNRQRFPWLPALPAAQEELSRVAALYRSATVLSGTAATRERFLAALAGSDTLHFAGHTLPADTEPSAAQLVLAASGKPGDPETVSGSDLFASSLPRLRLVVLSGCGSAVPDASRTGSLFGLASPFLAAGAGAVVGTLWDLDDRISLSILPLFHRLYLDGISAAQALRVALLPWTRAPSGAPEPPATWSAFVVIETNDESYQATPRREP